MTNEMVTEDSNDGIMTPWEVASLFRVDPKTVTRWAADGRLSCTRTLGGHRRYYRAEVEQLLQEQHSARTMGTGRRPAPAGSTADG